MSNDIEMTETGLKICGEKKEGRYIFVTGGVISSVGKGVITASLVGLLGKSCGLKVRVAKLDPYLNYDAGTMNPFQHGEVYVTEDGSETDLDLGYYERFSGVEVDKWSNITGGKIMKHVIDNEREGKYLGDTVQINKQVVDEVLAFIRGDGGVDVTVCEIGGSVDDLEARWFIEAARRLGRKAFHIHVCYLPYIGTAKELKTRPTQRSVSFLRGLGINIDVLVCRCEGGVVFGEAEKRKLTVFCGLEEKQVLSCPDVKSIYQVPLLLWQQGLLDLIGVGGGLESGCDIGVWSDLVKRIETVESGGDVVRVAIVGKYVPMDDAYKSLVEALWSAGLYLGKKVEIVWVDARKLGCSSGGVGDGEGDGGEERKEDYLCDGMLTVKGKELVSGVLKGVDCVVVAGGFGVDAVFGKSLVLTYCRVTNIPLLGICFGMQLMALEYCNNVCDGSVTSEEFGSEALGLKMGVGNGKGEVRKVEMMVKVMRKEVKIGGSMRLGGQRVKLTGGDGERVRRLYGDVDEIVERHRHRYDVDKSMFEEHCEMLGGAMKIVGESDGIPEIITIGQHKFYVGVQYHPEFKSSPFKAHPLFVGLFESCL